MNKVILIGRLTKNPEIRWSQGAEPLAIARYTLAVDKRIKSANSEQTANFIPCVAFGKNGEFAEKYLRKGIKILVCGRLETGSYTNKEGNKVYYTEVVVEEHEFAESKAATSDNGGGYQAADRPVPDPASAEGFMSIPEGMETDLPFKE